jgi:hypothetical protein
MGKQCKHPTCGDACRRVKAKKKVAITKRAQSLSLPAHLERTQKAFNEYIRERDKSNGCISLYCRGEVEHAGHYFSQGQHSKVRFDEKNVNGQCCKCNTYQHGNLIRYRQGLVKKYGEHWVAILEATAKGIYKWTIPELIALHDHYKSLTKSLKDA